MNAIAISVGSITVYWSSLIIALGVLAGPRNGAFTVPGR